MSNFEVDLSVLCQRAIETRLRNHCWPAKKIETQIDADASEKYGVKKGSTKTTKILVCHQSQPLWRKVVLSSDRMYQAWKKMTTPWRDGGFRLCCINASVDFLPNMEQLQDDYHAAVAECAERWDVVVASQEDRLKELFVASEYPTANEVIEACWSELETQPIQSAGDFRVELPPEQMARLKAASERSTRKAVEVAMKEPWRRLHHVVQEMVVVLATPDKTFRDSLRDNIAAVCDLLPQLNVAGDPRLDEMAKKVKVALHDEFDPEGVRFAAWKRKSETHATRHKAQIAQDNRVQACDKANAILKEINAIM